MIRVSNLSLPVDGDLEQLKNERPESWASVPARWESWNCCGSPSTPPEG